MPFKAADTKRWLLDIRDNILLARKFVAGLAYEQFHNNDMAFYAATRCLEVISEASRRLPPELKERHPTIPWGRMASAGNVYRHDYEDVEQRFIWQAIQNRLPELLVVVEQELATSPSGQPEPL